VHALTGVDLDVTAGQLTALVGDNGAGQSTLIEIERVVFRSVPSSSTDVCPYAVCEHPVSMERLR